MVETNTHPRKFVVRGPNEPEQPFDGQIWIDTSGSNIELNQYDAGKPGWELVIARGPDTPEYPVEGALWADTGVLELKQYENGAWDATTVSDHSNLSGVTAGQHNGLTHPKYTYDYTRSSSAGVTNPGWAWDGDTSNEAAFESTGETLTYTFGYPLYLGEFRHYGGTYQNGDGEFTIEARRHGNWRQVATVSTVGTTWSSWVSVDAYGDAFRFTATVSDSGRSDALAIRHFQFG